MRRTATTLLVSAFILSTLSGCALFKKKDKTAQGSYGPAFDSTTASTIDYPAYEPVSITDDYPTMTSAMPAESMLSDRFHTVAKKDTLYAIARMYYNGDHTRWKEIYEANRANIPNPNMIRVGQRLVIP